MEWRFSVSRDCLVDNSKEELLVAKRLVYTGVGIGEGDVTNKVSVV